jgi:hypothetical protein
MGEILHEALLERESDFAARSEAFRRRLRRSTVNSAEIIRADPARDGAA